MYHLSVKHRKNRSFSLNSLKTQESRRDLVSATVAVTTGWCAIEVIDVVSAAVSHLNVGGPGTTACDSSLDVLIKNHRESLNFVQKLEKVNFFGNL